MALEGDAQCQEEEYCPHSVEQHLHGWRSHLMLVEWLLDNRGDEAKNLAELTLQRGTDTAHLKQLLCSTLLFLALHLSACMA